MGTWVVDLAALALAATLSVASSEPGAGSATPMLGRVVLKCILQVDGTVQGCEVEAETPEGLGLGAKALDLVRRQRFSRTPEPRVVRIPMNFPIIDEAPPPASPPP